MPRKRRVWTEARLHHKKEKIKGKNTTHNGGGGGGKGQKVMDFGGVFDLLNFVPHLGGVGVAAAPCRWRNDPSARWGRERKQEKRSAGCESRKGQRPLRMGDFKGGQRVRKKSINHRS